MPDKFVEFTNARTNQSVWVNPDHVRNAQAVPGKPDWTELAMGGKGQDVAVQGDPKSVLKELTEQRSPVSKSLTPPPPKRTPSRPPKPSFTSTDVSLRLPEVVWGGAWKPLHHPPRCNWPPAGRSTGWARGAIRVSCVRQDPSAVERNPTSTRLVLLVLRLGHANTPARASGAADKCCSVAPPGLSRP